MNNLTPLQAAQDYSKKWASQKYILAALHEYCDIHSKPLFWRLRLKNSEKNDKKILPMHQQSDGKYIFSEPQIFSENLKPLYKLPDLITASNDPVYIHEGEACADAFSKLGLTSTTSGGWNSADKADWSVLKNRTVIIWPDADECGAKYAERVAEILLSNHCQVWLVDIDVLDLPNKGDCIDWLEPKPSDTEEDIKLIKDDIFALQLVEIKETDTTNQNISDTSDISKEYSQHEFSKAEMLLELMSNVTFFHDELKQAYASFSNNGHVETWLIDCNQFKNWLSHQFWKVHKKFIHETTLRDALAVMKGKALFEGDCHKVFTRIAKVGDKTYINLANANWQVIEITETGWSVLNVSPVKFRLLSNMKPLPIPETNGDYNLLWKHINVPIHMQILILAWMLDCWIPNTAFPLLILTGLQGSGKSRTQEILRCFIDPSIPNLRGAPKNSDDILIAAANNWLVSYNNVSKLTGENQDDLCCLSTGGGFAKRKLYSNDEEAVIDIKRPVIINGIGDLVTRQDLIDRCIMIDLPSITESIRKTDEQLDREFNRDYPVIFSGLLSLFSNVLAALPDTTLENKPRMASFAMLGATLERLMNMKNGSFLHTYKGNYQSSMLSALDSSPVAVALIKFMQNKNDFNGTYHELLNQISHPFYRPEMAGWPKSAKGLATVLKRQSPALAIIGINVQFDEKPKNDGYHIRITSNLYQND